MKDHFLWQRPQMELVLTGELEAFIQKEVSSGRYLNAVDVVRDALRTLEQREWLESPELEAELLEGLEGPHVELTPALLDRIRSECKKENESQG